MRGQWGGSHVRHRHRLRGPLGGRHSKERAENIRTEEEKVEKYVARVRVIPSISRYSIGESLDLNCSSELTLPPANLTWYINQRPVIKIF